jgi:hypothetical protein
MVQIRLHGPELCVAVGRRVHSVSTMYQTKGWESVCLVTRNCGEGKIVSCSDDPFHGAAKWIR